MTELAPDDVKVQTNAPDDYKRVPFYLTKKQCLRALGVSPTTLRNWETQTENPLPRYRKGTREIRYEIQEVFKWYFSKRIELEGGDGRPLGMKIDAPTPTINLKQGVNAQKERLVQAQAEGQEIKNKIALAELAPIQLLEDTLSDLCGQISSILGAISSRLRKKYSWLKSSQIEEIEREIVKAQNAASECTIDLPERPTELGDPPNDSSPFSEAIVGLESPTPDQRI